MVNDWYRLGKKADCFSMVIDDGQWWLIVVKPFHRGSKCLRDVLAISEGCSWPVTVPEQSNQPIQHSKPSCCLIARDTGCKLEVGFRYRQKCHKMFISFISCRFHGLWLTFHSASHGFRSQSGTRYGHVAGDDCSIRCGSRDLDEQPTTMVGIGGWSMVSDDGII